MLPFRQTAGYAPLTRPTGRANGPRLQIASNIVRDVADEITPPNRSWNRYSAIGLVEFDESDLMARHAD